MMKKQTYFILFIYICLANFNLFGQSIPSIQYHTSTGHPISNAYKIFQLKDSTYMICTNDGFVNFDGNYFKNEEIKNSNNTQSIIDACLINDSIIIYTSFREGLFSYNYKTKINTKLKLKSSKTIFFKDGKSTINDFLGEAHNITLTNGSTLFLFKNYKENATMLRKTVIVYNLKTETYEVIYDVLNAKEFNSKLYYLSNDTIFLYNDKKSLICLLNKLNIKNIENFCINNDTLYCVANQKLYTIKNNQLIKTENLTGYKNKIIDIEKDAYGNFWFLTSDYSFYKYYNKTLTIIEDGTYKYNNILIDYNQNLFMTSYTDGLNVYYNTYINNYGVKDGVKNKNINKIKKIDTSIYVCTNNGLYTLKNEKINYITFNNLDLPYVYDVMPINNKVLILSSGILYKQNIDSKHLSFNRNVICKLKNNWMLYSSWNSEIQFDENFSFKNSPKTTSMIVLPDTFSKKNYVIGISQYNDSMVFANTNIGVYKINIFTKKYEKIKFINDRVTQICYNQKHNQYLFCANNVIYVLTNNNWTKITNVNNQPLTKITACEFDLKGRLWIATSKGVYITDKKENKKLTSQMGLLSNEVLCLFLDSTENKMYVGTNNGFSVIDVNILDKSNTKPPTISIKAFITNNDTIYDYENHRFNSEQNSIEILLNNIIYPNTNTIKIKYAIDGIETEKEYSNIIKFSSLSQEGHVFKIKASIDGLNWSEEQTINFQISKPLHKTIAFYAFILILFIIVTIYTSNIIIDKNKKNAEFNLKLQNENNNLKFQALNSNINPHFIFNALYSIQNYVYNNKGSIASDYLAKLSRLIRIILEQAENIDISLKDELEKLTFYIQLEKMRFGDGLDIELINKIKTNPSEIKIPNMIIQPLIENAIIHGLQNNAHNGKISITFLEEDDELKISINDNGIGFNRSLKITKINHKSIGLQNVKARLALIKNASIQIIDKCDIGNDSGTIINVYLPKNNVK